MTPLTVAVKPETVGAFSLSFGGPLEVAHVEL